MTVTNKFSSKCNACQKPVPAGAGVVEHKPGWNKHRRRNTGRWICWCLDCFNRSDMSGPEDRECGLRAYEDRCAAAVGGEAYYGGIGW